MRSLSIATLLTMSLALAACYGDGDRAGSARADGAASSPTEGTKGTVTKPKSLSEALAKAKSSGKNVLVYYGSTTCPWSRQMKEQTMLDSEVQAALRDFVYMRLEQGETAQEFEKRWGKQPTPTLQVDVADVRVGETPAPVDVFPAPVSIESTLRGFSCQTRNICPSCQQKRAELLAEKLREEILAPVAHRHAICTVPKALRRLFLWERRLLGILPRCAAETITRCWRAALDREDGVPGIVASIQTFGSQANWHPELFGLPARPRESGGDPDDVHFRGGRARSFRLALRRVARLRADVEPLGLGSLPRLEQLEMALQDADPRVQHADSLAVGRFELLRLVPLLEEFLQPVLDGLPVVHVESAGPHGQGSGRDGYRGG